MLKYMSLPLLSALIFVSLQGCGFKLRGNLEIPTYLKTVYITPYELYEPLQHELRSRLRQADVKVVDSAIKNVTTLEISRPSTSEQVLAYGSSGEVQRLKISILVTYKLTIHGKNVEQTQRTITRTREINRNNNMLLSNEEEQRVVKHELVGEVVTELLRQVTSRPPYKETTPCSSSTATSINPC